MLLSYQIVSISGGVQQPAQRKQAAAEVWGGLTPYRGNDIRWEPVESAAICQPSSVYSFDVSGD